MNKPKIPKEITNVLLDLGVELLKTLKDLNSQNRLKTTNKPQKKKGVKDGTSTVNKGNRKKVITLPCTTGDNLSSE